MTTKNACRDTASGLCDCDGIVTETFVSLSGFPFDLMHCKRCGAGMAKPVSPRKEPERYRRLASPEAIAMAIRLHHLEAKP